MATPNSPKKDNVCSYCGKPLRKKYKLSYGWANQKQIQKCDRWGCTLKLKINRQLQKLINYLQRALK